MASYRKRNDNEILSGELRHRVSFLKRMITVKSGITKETWVPAFTCWAMVEPLNSREYWQAAAVNREDEQRVTIRYRLGVDSDMRIQFRGEVFSIISIVNPNARNIKLEMLAKSIVPDRKVEDNVQQGDP